MPDPWVVLGLPPGSSVAEARAARRRLAKELHPDLHAGRPAGERADLARRMTQVNLALAELESVARPGGGPPPRCPAGDEPRPAATALDQDSFSVEALPAEAFEALFLAAYGLGDILVADEPYLLDLYLPEPAPCFCRLSLVPEAGGTIVTVDVDPAEEGEPPAPAAIRDVLVAALTSLAGGG